LRSYPSLSVGENRLKLGYGLPTRQRRRASWNGSDDAQESDEQFMKRGKGILEILQSVEDALIDGGYDHFMVATNHGTFHWETRIERARGTPENFDAGPAGR
jgi:hypothetical protein